MIERVFEITGKTGTTKEFGYMSMVEQVASCELPDGRTANIVRNVGGLEVEIRIKDEPLKMVLPLDDMVREAIKILAKQTK